MFIFQQILFYISIILILFLPGYFLVLAIFRNNIKNKFSPIELFTVSFGISLIITNFIMIILGKLGFLLTKFSLIAGLGVFLALCYFIYKKSTQKEKKKTFSDFSKKQTALIILILFLTVFIKTTYLKDTIFPTSTDLGHHMYWSKLISQTGELPSYEKLEIVPLDSGYALRTERIADFIIGEHLVFSAVNILSNINFFSYFPTLILFLINIISILAIFILTLRLFSRDFIENASLKIGLIKDPKNIAITTLLLLGPLYAVASPQAKFVSGGVIGNIMGNLIIPLSVYFYFRAIKERDSWMMFLALLTSSGLFFIHHLSSLIFIFIFIFIVIFLDIILATNLLFSRKKLETVTDEYKLLFKKYFKVIFSTQNILFLIFIAIFTFFVYTPSYLNADATGTAVGAPSKSTRTGLTLSQFKYAIGEPRLALGIIGLILIAITSLPKKESRGKIKINKLLTPAILIGWSVAVSLMTLKPHWLYINIPSGRVANYANFPFTIIAAFAIVWIIYFISSFRKSKLLLPVNIVFIFTALLFLTIFSSGHYDNSQSLAEKNNSQMALETFHASKYLSANSDYSSSDAMVLKDHNYIKADAWIKLFFMKDYSYPLSRGFFKRYEDPTKPREMCTLWMIESPSSEKAQTCYRDTQTKFIIINPDPDSVQFEKNSNFWKIYSGDEVNIFYKS